MYVRQKPFFRWDRRVEKLAVLTVCSLCFFKQARDLHAVETHGVFRTIYYPHMEEVYNSNPYSIQKQVINPYLIYVADRQADPLVRQLMIRQVRDYVKQHEMENRLVHSAYQSANLRFIDIGGNKNISLVIDGLVRSLDQRDQTEVSLRQLHYRHTYLFPFIKELKIGRVFSTAPAGIANYDGASVQFVKGYFGMTLYGGALIDNDYLNKPVSNCNSYPIHSSCLTGQDFAREDYSNKWKASDVRNVSARERRGDTLSAVTFGLYWGANYIDLDFQRKTDAKLRAEELGGLNVLIKPSAMTKIYANSKVNLIRGEQHYTLVGFSQGVGNWRFMPEYEYYKPQFKRGSFWESFHTFGRATARARVYRDVGRKLRLYVGAGKLYYLADNTASESLTTCTMVDPMTGDTIGCRDKYRQQAPVNPLDVKGNPTATDPLTGRTQSVPARPMSPEEAWIFNYLNPPYHPGSGAEGQMGIEYNTAAAWKWHANAQTLQGPEGRLTKASAMLEFPVRRFRIRGGVGQAYYQAVKSNTGREKATYADLELKYFMNTALTLSGGAEYYSDPHHKYDVRGRLVLRYAF